jgi:hypothetical protein
MQKRAWHLAAAAAGPDEAAAAELEHAAADAATRSGYAAAAAAYELAARLTADPAARAGRLVQAALAATEIGVRPRPRLVTRSGPDDRPSPPAQP